MNMSMIYDYLTKTLEALNENAIKEKYNKTFKKNKNINTEE